MEPKRNCTNINSNSLQSLITQICARSKSLLILWNFLKIGVANFFEDATHRLSNILPMAFRTYRSWPLAYTPARNIRGRSKLWCWRHKCTVRGSTLGAVYTSLNGAASVNKNNFRTSSDSRFGMYPNGSKRARMHPWRLIFVQRHPKTY